MNDATTSQLEFAPSKKQESVPSELMSRESLPTAAYVVMHALRNNLLKSSEFTRAQFDTIRLHLPASYLLKPVACGASTILAALDIS